MSAQAPLPEDPIRSELLAAAARVFATTGYAGAKVQDIVREANLSTGVIYGRFQNKEELLRQAVVEGANNAAPPVHLGGRRVADIIEHLATLSDAPLAIEEALRLEAFVTARREPIVAEAVIDTLAAWRNSVDPLLDAARSDGTVAADVDVEAVLFFVQTLYLGLLLQRGFGLDRPDATGWNSLIRRVVASFGDHPTEGDTST